MTAPGGGTATSGGLCTPETPCFVCEVKALAKAQGVSGEFSDAPFAINLVGCRRAHSISDQFDDRMIAFFSLPADDAGKTLADGGVESALIDDIAAAAKAVNGALVAGRGVRRVACSSVELEPGKPASGHRVVAMFPITTDPGLVRLPAQQDKEAKRLQDAVAQRDARLKELKDGKKKLTDELIPELDKQGQALKDAPKANPKSPAQTAAEQGLAAAKKAIVDLAAKLKIKTATAAEIDKQIAAVDKERGALNDQLTSWNSGELTAGEKKAFEGYRYAFRTENGWEGDGHAFFPLGFQKNRFVLGQHHWSSDGATPALVTGLFLGERMYSGKLLKKEFASCLAWPLDQRRAPALKAAKASAQARAALEKKERADLDKTKAKTPAADFQAKVAALKQQQADRAAKESEASFAAVNDAGREYVVITDHRKAQGAKVASGSWIVLGCEIQKGDGGKAPLPDADEFEIEGDAHRRTGRDVRLHYYALAGKTPDAGLKIHAHHPASGPELPAGSKIVATEPKIEQGGALLPIADDDLFEVQAMIGGTNIHRGHNLKVDGETVSASAENPNFVHNWSTGCQVFWAFKDYNLFILLAGLSKRWKCLQAKTTSDCARITSGSESAPDPATWTYAKTKLHFPPDDLAASIKADMTALQGEQKTAAADLKSKLDAWYKTQKGVRRPPKDDDAATQMGTTLDAQIAALPEDQREAPAKDRASLAEATARRDALAAQKRDLDGVQALLAHDATTTYVDAANTLATLQKQLDDEAPTFTSSPQAKKAAEGGSKAVAQAVTNLQKACHDRAVKLKHDWERTCDLAEKCSQKFSYALVELVGSDATGKVVTLDKVDADFSKKAGKDDANPLWSGFAEG